MPLEAVAGRRPALRPPRREAARPVRARATRRAGDREQWLLIHKHDDDAVAGWDPEDHPRSVKIGAHQRRDQVGSGGDVVEQRIVGRTDGRRAGRARRPPPSRRAMDVRRAHAQADEPRQGADPGQAAAPGGHQARPDPPLRRHGPGDAAVPARPADQPAPLPGRDRPAAGSGTRRDRRTPPTSSGRWRNADADPGETEVYAVLDNPAALAWAANFGAIELHPWTSTADQPHRPTWAMVDIDPGTSSTLRGRGRRWPGCTAPPSTTSASRRVPRSPAGAASRSGSRSPAATRSTTPARWVENALADHRRHRARAGELEVGEVEAQGAALDSTTRRTRSTRPSSRRSALRPRPGAPVSVPITLGRARRSGPAAGSMEHRQHRRAPAEAGDPLAPLIGKQQTLPKL